MIRRVFLPQNSVAVLGGATQYSNSQVIAAYKIGQELARKGKTLVTGATTGIPYAASIGAKRGDTIVVGISPALNFEEHVEVWGKPPDYADLIIYTGLGYDVRSSILMRSVSGAIFVGGEFGTLNEFSSACLYPNKVIGILQGFGGISDSFQDIFSKIQTEIKSRAIFDSDPVRLVDRVCRAVDKSYSDQINKIRFGEIGKDVQDMINKHFPHEETGR